MLEKYSISPEAYAEHEERVRPEPQGSVVKYSLARTDPSYFCTNNLGIRPYSWQSKLWDGLLRGSNMMVCSARQIGKTFSIAAYCLWAITFNTMPLDTTKKTRIIIVSATEEQSKKIISDIRELMRIGDEYIFNITAVKDRKSGKPSKGGVKDYFTGQMDRRQESSNTKSSITFMNGCQVISLPPTERARGYTGSLLFIDEAAFIEEEDIYESTLQNIVAKTGNRICMTSTPNGQQGFFFKLFDPHDEAPSHPFKRLWIPYQSLALDDPELVRQRDEKKQLAVALGNERQFQQEHEASFMSATASFFDSEDVDKAVDKNDVGEETCSEPCDLAVDFGHVYSRTVITISRLDKRDGETVIRVLYQYEYPPQKDMTLVNDIYELMKRYRIERIIFEHCPAAATFMQQAEKRGWNLVEFNPTRDKAKKYILLRTWLRQRRVIIPGVFTELVREMKGLVQEETPRTTKIHHGAGLRDDRVDSFMMSTVFFTDEKPPLRVWDWDDL